MNFTKESHFLPLLSTAGVVLVFLIVEVFHWFFFALIMLLTGLALRLFRWWQSVGIILLLFTLPTNLELFCISKNSIICTEAAAM